MLAKPYAEITRVDVAAMSRRVERQLMLFTGKLYQSIEVTDFEDASDNLLSVRFWSESGYPILE